MERSTTLGSYELLDRIGGRGVAQVFVGRRLNRTGATRLAIKVLRSELANQREALEIFQAKARIASLVEHEHLVRTLEVGASEDGIPFICMEFVEGLKLSELLTRDVPIPPTVAVEIARQIAEALHHLHTLQYDGADLAVVHLEVCPENVLLTREGKVMLLDGGVPMSSVRWDAGYIVSNVAYLAPEQARRERQIDQGADLFSLGRLLAALMDRSPVLDPSLRNIIARGTATRPEERYRTAAELTDALHVYLLTQPQFNPQVAVRSLITNWEHSMPVARTSDLPRALVDPLLAHSSDVVFTADTRVRTLDLPRRRSKPWVVPVLIGATLLAVAAALVIKLLQ